MTGGLRRSLHRGSKVPSRVDGRARFSLTGEERCSAYFRGGDAARIRSGRNSAGCVRRSSAAASRPRPSSDVPTRVWPSTAPRPVETRARPRHCRTGGPRTVGHRPGHRGDGRSPVGGRWAGSVPARPRRRPDPARLRALGRATPRWAAAGPRAPRPRRPRGRPGRRNHGKWLLRAPAVTGSGKGRGSPTRHHGAPGAPSRRRPRRWRQDDRRLRRELGPLRTDSRSTARRRR